MSLYEHGFDESDGNGHDAAHASGQNVQGNSSVNAGSTGNGNANTSYGQNGWQSGTAGNGSTGYGQTGSTGNTGYGQTSSGYGQQNGTGSSNYGQNGYGQQNGSYNGNGQNGYWNGQNYGQPYGQAPNNRRKAKKPKVKKAKAPHPFARKIGIAAAVAVVFGAVGGVSFRGSEYLTQRALGTDQKTESSADGATLSTSDDGSLSRTSTSSATTVTDVSDIVKNVMPAIVQVTNVGYSEYQTFIGTFRQPTESAGSGIIISQDDDYIYIATNNHVVSDSTSLTVTFANDKAVSAEVQGTDPDTDLAVVKVKVSDIDSDTLSAIKVATIGSSKDLNVGESAIVIGNALGYGQSVTTGVISALDREVSVEGENGETITNKLIQTDAAVNPGNSGGALLNMNGEVVGIVSAKYSDTDVEGMGYAIPISSASSVIQSLIKGETVTHDNEAASSETGAYLGIYGMDINSQTSMSYQMPTGVYVMQAIDGQAAANAGIKKGDIITAVDGTEVSSMEELKAVLAKYQPGQEIEVTVARGSSHYKTETVKVTLGSTDDKQQSGGQDQGGSNK